MIGDEAPPSSSSALQDAMRQIVADATANAATHTNVAEMRRELGEVRRDIDALKQRLDRHLAESERDRADTEQALGEQRAAAARIEAEVNRLVGEVKRLADAKAAEVALAQARVNREVETATISAARWKEWGAIAATATGFVALALKEVVQWLRSRP